MDGDRPLCQLCTGNCAVRITLLQTFMKTFVIFCFGFYLKRRDSAATLVCTIPNMDTNERKQASIACLRPGSKPSSCLIFPSQVGEEVTKFESLL